MHITIVGLGIMGSAMTRRLLEAGHVVTVFNRTRSKAESLIALGAHFAETPALAAREADVVLTLVTNPAAVDDVSLGENGILAALRRDAVHADMSTVTPQSAGRMAEVYSAAGKRFVQGPVLGSKSQIEQSTLLIMAGGDGAAIDACRAAWSAFSTKIWTLETAAQASAMKLSCNMLIAQTILGLGQSLTFARKYGISTKAFLEVIDASAMASPMMRTKGNAIASGNFNANFVVRNMLKDLDQAGDAAQSVGDLPLPLNELARELFAEAVAADYGDEDYSAVVKVLAAKADVTLEDKS